MRCLRRADGHGSPRRVVCRAGSVCGGPVLARACVPIHGVRGCAPEHVPAGTVGVPAKGVGASPSFRRNQNSETPKRGRRCAPRASRCASSAPACPGFGRRSKPPANLIATTQRVRSQLSAGKDVCEVLHRGRVDRRMPVLRSTAVAWIAGCLLFAPRQTSNRTQDRTTQAQHAGDSGCRSTGPTMPRSRPGPSHQCGFRDERDGPPEAP